MLAFALVLFKCDCSVEYHLKQSNIYYCLATHQVFLFSKNGIYKNTAFGRTSKIIGSHADDLTRTNVI